MATGVRRVVVVPSPSCPLVLEPQHFTPPPLVSAQVWLVPAATAVTPLDRPLTATGARRCVVVPSPSCPKLLLPQHHTPPPLVSAQVWEPPAATAVTPLNRPITPTD